MKDTVLCISVSPRPHSLETRVFIFRPILATQETLTAFHGDEVKSKIQNGQLKKNGVF